MVRKKEVRGGSITPDMMSEEEGDDHEFMDLCGDLKPSTNSLKN